MRRQEAVLFRGFLAAVFMRDAADKKSGDRSGIDFDPVTDSQDPNVADLRIEVSGQTAEKTMITAKFRQFKVPAAVLCVVIAGGRAWKRDDIHGGLGADAGQIRKRLANP